MGLGAIAGLAAGAIVSGIGAAKRNREVKAQNAQVQQFQTQMAQQATALQQQAVAQKAALDTQIAQDQAAIDERRKRVSAVLGGQLDPSKLSGLETNKTGPLGDLSTPSLGRSTLLGN